MMKPIYEFKTIQVELTNACVHSCSNCTRFCGHHKKPFYMEWETFKTAIDSLENWPRIVGIMGGEPTLHPQFERYVNYAYEKHPMQYEIGGGAHPTKSLSKYLIDANAIKSGPLNKFKGLGLWSTVTEKYYKHYELIQDKFIFQCINDHTASSRHQPWLMSRKEFGITDEEWIPMRNNCWWHRTLNSPSITPKGAFFCEVAAAMDMLFDGPGGWKVEKDWWKRDFDDYKDQLHWCELCCGAFITFDRDANEEVDDISPLMYQKLLDVGSPKAKKEGRVIVHEISKDGELKTKPRKNMLLYQDNDELRFTSLNKSLYPKRVHGIIWSESQEVEQEYIMGMEQIFDGVSRIYAKDEKAFVTLAKVLREEKDWVAIIPDKCEIEDDFRSKMNDIIFNPGTFHSFAEQGIIMFHVDASSLKKHGFAAIGNLNKLNELSSLWNPNKISILNKNYENVEGPDLEVWIEVLTKKGIIEFNYIRPHINDMIIRRRINPEIKCCMSSLDSIENRIASLDQVYHKSVTLESMVNKMKTVIHNAIAAELKTSSFAELKDKLKDKRKGKPVVEGDSFCLNYALAMLSVGDEKIDYLTKCVIHKDNKYLLGLESLKRHYDFFDREKNKAAVQIDGVIMEIVNLATIENELCLAGNRYTGKSISMILSHAGKKAKMFIDDDKVGSYFDELPTVTIADYLDQCKKNPMIMTQNNDLFEDDFLLSLERKKSISKVYKLHPLVYTEMSMSSNILEIGITQKEVDDIKKLSDSREASSKCKEILTRR